MKKSLSRTLPVLPNTLLLFSFFLAPASLSLSSSALQTNSHSFRLDVNSPDPNKSDSYRDDSPKFTHKHTYRHQRRHMHIKHDKKEKLFYKTTSKSPHLASNEILVELPSHKDMLRHKYELQQYKRKPQHHKKNQKYHLHKSQEYHEKQNIDKRKYNKKNIKQKHLQHQQNKKHIFFLTENERKNQSNTVIKLNNSTSFKEYNKNNKTIEKTSNTTTEVSEIQNTKHTTTTSNPSLEQDDNITDDKNNTLYNYGDYYDYDYDYSERSEHFGENSECPTCKIRDNDKKFRIMNFQQRILHTLDMKVAPNITRRVKPKVPGLVKLYEQLDNEQMMGDEPRRKSRGYQSHYWDYDEDVALKTERVFTASKPCKLLMQNPIARLPK